MLMLTHTWLLKELIGVDHIIRDNLDIFAYNVSPDLLTIHPSITPKMTHRIPLSSRLPAQHRKAAFIQFHLLVDDMAHYGKIGEGADTGFDFNPNSNGYAYVKGRSLVQPIMNFYRDIGAEVSFSDAAYRSHIIIEMAFDLTVNQKNGSLTALFSEALSYTVENKFSEFSKTLSWFFSIEQKTITEAIEKGIKLYTKDRMDSLMSLDGRVHLYAAKFHHDPDDNSIRNNIKNLFTKGMYLVADYEDFLHTTLKATEKSGFKPQFRLR
jgi:hypothetical protein